MGLRPLPPSFADCQLCQLRHFLSSTSTSLACFPCRLYAGEFGRTEEKPPLPLLQFVIFVRIDRGVLFILVRFSSARLAQSVERKAFDLVVVGSIPTVGVVTFRAWLVSFILGCHSVSSLYKN